MTIKCLKKAYTTTVHFLFYRLNLFKRLLLSYSLIIFLPSILLTFFSYSYISKNLVNQFLYSSDMSLQQTSIYLDKILEEIMSSTEQIAFSDILTDILTQNESHQSMAETYAVYRSAIDIIKGALQADAIYSSDIYIKENPFFVSKKSPGNEGISLVSIESDYARKLDSMLRTNQRKMLWFQRTLQKASNGELISVITGARYMKNTNDYKTNIGMITVNIRQETLNSIIDHSSILPNSITFLTDFSGNLLAVSNEELFQKYNLSPELIQDKLTRQDSLSRSRGTLLINSVSIPTSNWNLVSVLPYDEILKTSKSTRNQLLLFMLIANLLFYVATYFISRMLSQRLKNLSYRMREVRFNNYTPIPAEPGDDEINDLINSYNHMLNKINDYAESQYQLGIALKTSELNILQAQINPHFLYNTLDLLNCIAWEHGIKEISEIVSLLTRFYKLSLNKGIEMSSVKDALEQIEVYIKLQNFRFESSIKLIINIVPDLYPCRILKLLLQPIIENSIIHGILEKEVPSGTITVDVRASDGILSFTITDDGVGMTPEKAYQLTHPLECNISGSASPAGYGIKNVIERIKLYYGDEYGLICQSRPNEGTTVLLRVPISDT